MIETTITGHSLCSSGEAGRVFNRRGSFKTCSFAGIYYHMLLRLLLLLCINLAIDGIQQLLLLCGTTPLVCTSTTTAVLLCTSASSAPFLTMTVLFSVLSIINSHRQCSSPVWYSYRPSHCWRLIPSVLPDSRLVAVRGSSYRTTSRYTATKQH